MNEKMQELRDFYSEIARLSQASAVLHWDEATYLPEKAAEARAEQSAALQSVIHEKMTSPKMASLLQDLENYEQGLPEDSVDKRYLQLVRKEYERSTCLPAAFQKEYTKHVSATYQTWIKAKAENNFKKIEPYLEKALDLVLQKTEYYKGFAHPLDSLMADADEGMTVDVVKTLFTELKNELVPIVKKLKEASQIDDSCLKQKFPIELQHQFGEMFVRQMGYDFSKGRLDKTHHPFCTSFSAQDVRITTRYSENDLTDSVWSTIHEGGHALYEQGVDLAYEASPLSGGTSMSVHESQSRLWENQVGRSLECWQFFYPKLQAMFPEVLQNVDLKTFYRAINTVKPSLIRVDADEVTYNLHVMIRFELELQMMEGKLAIKDLPQAWNAAYQANLGITPPDDKTGVMQDVHWYGGILGGYFQSYTLGNLMSAQFYNAALQKHPEIRSQMTEGNFTTLHEYLRTNIYQHGKRYPTFDLIKRVTDNTIQVAPFISYLKKKYAQIYEIDL